MKSQAHTCTLHGEKQCDERTRTIEKELVIRWIGRGSNKAEELTLEFVNPDISIISHLPRSELFRNLTFWGFFKKNKNKENTPMCTETPTAKPNERDVGKPARESQWPISLVGKQANIASVLNENDLCPSGHFMLQAKRGSPISLPSLGGVRIKGSALVKAFKVWMLDG